MRGKFAQGAPRRRNGVIASMRPAHYAREVGLPLIVGAITIKLQ